MAPTAPMMGDRLFTVASDHMSAGRKAVGRAVFALASLLLVGVLAAQILDA